MTKEDLAARLDGREIGEEITEEEAQQAQASGLVVVYGYSDDNAEVEGVFRDEIGLYDGGSFRLDSDGVPGERDNRWTDEEMLDYLSSEAVTVTGEWCPDDEATSWRFSASVPFASFVIKEDDTQFCRGIVFEAPTGRAR